MEYTFTLSEKEANYLLNNLAKAPFAEVAELINKIQLQAQKQTTEQKHVLKKNVK